MNKENQEKVSLSATEELATVRNILFGEAQNTLEQKLSSLQASLDQGLSSLKYDFSEKLKVMHENIDKSLTQIEEKIHYVDSQHDDKNSVLDKNLSNLVSEHEIFASTTETSLETLNGELDKEAQQLSHNFSIQLESLKQELNKVSLELHSSKTDRKTLAKLLATMATNLEDDEL